MTVLEQLIACFPLFRLTMYELWSNYDNYKI